MMRDAFRNAVPSVRLLMAAPVAAALLAGCRPDSPGGYDKVPARGEPGPIVATNPPPPPADPSVLSSGGGGAPVVLNNPPAGVTQAMVDAGQQSFATVCVACHASGGAGGPAGPALNDGDWINISGAFPEIVTVIANGVPQPKEYAGAMPPKGGGNFTDEQVRELAAYVYALSHQ